MGLKLEGPQQEVEQPQQNDECWPDHWLPFLVFAALDTQWQHGSSGQRTGLKYEAIPVVLEQFGVEKKMRADVIGAVWILEKEALEVFYSG